MAKRSATRKASATRKGQAALFVTTSQRETVMRDFALTYPQLINQAMQCGLEEEDLVRLGTAYELVLRLTDGLYRAEGSPLLCHLVRTASIVMAEGLSPDAVLASLLHAAYILRYFDGSRRRRPRKRDRAFLRRKVGAEVERLVAAYGKLPWYSAHAIQQHIQQAPQVSDATRQILIMRLANELEDHLDLAMAFTPDDRGAARFAAYGSQCVKLARALGHRQLGDELTESFERCAASAIPKALVRDKRNGYELDSRLWKANFIERTVRRGLRWLSAVRGLVA